MDLNTVSVDKSPDLTEVVVDNLMQLSCTAFVDDVYNHHHCINLMVFTMTL